MRALPIACSTLLLAAPVAGRSPFDAPVLERAVDAEACLAGLQMLARHAAGTAPEVRERFSAQIAPERGSNATAIAEQGT